MLKVTRPRTAALALALLLAGVAQQCAAQLITQAESDREQKHLAEPILVAKDVTPGAPKIEVLEPANLQQPLAAPVAIRVRFVPENGATVERKSLRVYYGVFGVDITERLLQKARFEQNQLTLDRAEIPSGTHRLTMSVADSQNRVAEKQITFTIR